MGFTSIPERNVYSATKSALLGLARASALDLGQFGITVKSDNESLESLPFYWAAFPHWRSSSLSLKSRVMSAKEYSPGAARKVYRNQWDEDDFDLAVRSLRAFLQRLRQSQGATRTHGRKTPAAPAA